MTPYQLFLLLIFAFCSAKYAPQSSLYKFEKSSVWDGENHDSMHHTPRRLIDEEVKSYMMHRYYMVTTRNGHDHAYGWKEISETGTRSSVSDVDDVVFEKLQLKKEDGWQNGFRFYGHLHDELYISANGFLTVMPDYSEGPCGRAFCEWSGHYYTRYIAPLMTDWNPGSRNESEVFYELGQNEDGENYLVVQWQDLVLWSNNGTFDDDPFSFQVIIEEDGDIIFNYKTLPFDPSTKILDQYGYKFTYPVNIGLEDAFIYHSTENSVLDGSKWTYYPLRLDYDNITHSQGRSVRIEALPTCQRFASCNDCVNYSLSHRNDSNALECGWCGAIGVCSDDIGREIASEADLCMAEDRQMQTTFDECRKILATPCGMNTTTPDEWPRTTPGEYANRACPLQLKRELQCPVSACFQVRRCNIWGEWENITTHCNTSQSLSPCPAVEDWKETIPGNASYVSCTDDPNSPAQKVRYCNFYGVWSDEDASACALDLGMSTGQITGIAVGSAIALLIIGVLIWMVSKGRSDLKEFKRLKNVDEPTEMVQGTNVN